jgi:hypothetical protein
MRHLSTVAVILLSALLPVVCFSQKERCEYVPFPVSEAIWTEVYDYGNEMTPPSRERFILTGEDTVMNGFVYKKLYLFDQFVFDKDQAKYVGGIREDDHKRVYYVCRLR